MQLVHFLECWDEALIRKLKQYTQCPPNIHSCTLSFYKAKENGRSLAGRSEGWRLADWWAGWRPVGQSEDYMHWGEYANHQFWLASIQEPCIVGLDMLTKWGAAVEVSRNTRLLTSRLEASRQGLGLEANRLKVSWLLQGLLTYHCYVMKPQQSYSSWTRTFCCLILPLHHLTKYLRYIHKYY